MINYFHIRSGWELSTAFNAVLARDELICSQLALGDPLPSRLVGRAHVVIVAGHSINPDPNAAAAADEELAAVGLDPESRNPTLCSPHFMLAEMQRAFGPMHVIYLACDPKVADGVCQRGALRSSVFELDKKQWASAGIAGVALPDLAGEWYEVQRGGISDGERVRRLADMVQFAADLGGRAFVSKFIIKPAATATAVVAELHARGYAADVDLTFMNMPIIVCTRPAAAKLGGGGGGGGCVMC